MPTLLNLVENPCAKTSPNPFIVFNPVPSTAPPYVSWYMRDIVHVTRPIPYFTWGFPIPWSNIFNIWVYAMCPNPIIADEISQPTNKFRFKSVNILVDITIPITGDAFSQFRTQSITCWKQTVLKWRAFVEPWIWNSPHNFQLDCNLFAYQFHFCLYTKKDSIVKGVQFFVAVGFMVESDEWWSNGEVEEKRCEWCWIW